MLHPNKTASHGTASLKGHLALNSSPLKPSINKLSSQDIIQDHMTSHYYNLATIKSAIDNKPPKSTTLSIKKQDQFRREIVLKQLRNGAVPRPKSASLNKSKRYSSSSHNENEEYTTSRPLTATSSWSPSHYNPYAQNETLRPKSASTRASRKSFGTEKLSPRSAENAPRKDVLNLTYSGDYLDRHQNRFQNAEGTPFTPRTKKRTAKSFLSQSKHYAPPVHSRKKKDPSVPSSPSSKSSYKHVTKDNVQRIDDRDRSSDHRKWIEEQSEFVQKLTLFEKEEQEKAYQRNRSRPSTASSVAKKQIDAEEEEIKYLQFVNEVTNDILTTGIYSDSVLNRLMERHVERRRHELSVKKMWEMLDRLKIDLGMRKGDGRKFVYDPDQSYDTATMRANLLASRDNRELYDSQRYDTVPKEPFDSDRGRYVERESTFDTVTSIGATRDRDSRHGHVGESSSKKMLDDMMEKRAFQKELSSSEHSLSPPFERKFPQKQSVSHQENLDARNLRSVSFGSKSSSSRIIASPAYSDPSIEDPQLKEVADMRSRSASILASTPSLRSLQKEPAGSTSSEARKSPTLAKAGSMHSLEAEFGESFKPDILTKYSSLPSFDTDIHKMTFEREKSKSTSVTSFKSSEQMRKKYTAASDEIFKEKTYQEEGSGLKSQSASSLGSRTSAGSMLRPRSAARGSAQSESMQAVTGRSSSNETLGKLDEEILPKRSSTSTSSQDDKASSSTVRSARKAKVEVDGVLNQDEGLGSIGARSMSVSSHGSRSSARSLRSERRRGSTDALRKVAIENGSKSVDDFQATVTEEARSRSSSYRSSHSETRLKSIDSPMKSTLQEAIEPTKRDDDDEHSVFSSKSPSIDTLQNSTREGSRESLFNAAVDKPMHLIEGEEKHSRVSSRTSSAQSLQAEKRRESADSLLKSTRLEAVDMIQHEKEDSIFGSRPSSAHSSQKSQRQGSNDLLRKIALENGFKTTDDHDSNHSSKASSAKSSRHGSSDSLLQTALPCEIKLPDETKSDEVLSNIAESSNRHSVISHESTGAKSSSSVIPKPRSSVLNVQHPDLQTSDAESTPPVPKKRGSSNFEKGFLSSDKTDSFDNFFNTELMDKSKRNSDLSLNVVNSKENRDSLVNEKLSSSLLEDKNENDEGLSSKKFATGSKSFLDEIREAALGTSSASAEPHKDTESESDYESVIALSTVMKPPDYSKSNNVSSDAGSEGRLSTVQRVDEKPTTSTKILRDTLTPESLESTLKSEARYSDDFEDDSDAF